MKKVWIPALLLAAVVSSCSKEDSAPSGSNGKFLSKVTITDFDGGQVTDVEIDTLQYTTNMMFSSFTTLGNYGAINAAVYNGNVMTAWKITPDGNPANYANREEYLYDANGRLFKVLDKESGPDEQYYDSLAYDAAGSLSRIYHKYVINNQPQISGSDGYTWDANGNITEIKWSISPTDATKYQGKTVFTYDGHPNPLFYTGNPIFWFRVWSEENASRNNVKTATDYGENGVNVIGYSTVDYTYDTDGTPLTAEKKDGNNVSDVLTTISKVNFYYLTR